MANKIFFHIKIFYSHTKSHIKKKENMKLIRLLIILTAFLVMISSVITLYATTERTPVYLNMAAMVVLIVIITLLNFQKKTFKYPKEKQ